jgi:hypothetical protein
VDIVTQWEVVAAVERISEAYLLPVIQTLLESFPFEVRGFHSDLLLRSGHGGCTRAHPQDLPGRTDHDAVGAAALDPGLRAAPQARHTAQSLSETAVAMTDSQAAQKLQDMRRNLFASFRRKRA